MRKLSGESLFMTTYSCKSGEGTIAFAAGMPGEIKVLNLAAGESIILQKTAFMAAERSVTLSTHFQKKIGAGLFGGG
jgi:uncharacterized protein (AIM24 family)